tara:strand:+ start:1502 stop:2173 length:672 start_codon:yes stop_codon:yes gene_type:complete
MNWIQESVKKSNKMKDHYKMQEIDIFIKDQLPEHINPDLVFSTFSKLIPSHLLSGVDIIYVGEFDVFKEKKVNAVFQDGAIYVSNEQDSNQDMIDDIIHELAHSVEEKFTQYIYDENDLKNEFLGKRKRLYDILNSYDYDPSIKIKTTYHYDEEIDMYFYQKVGYEAMWNLINGLFASPYSTTSLREYFAVGFEYYFMGEKTTIKKLSPILYSKLENLEYLEN